MIIEVREHDSGISKESVPSRRMDPEAISPDICSLLWRFYKKVLTFPVGSRGPDRKIGILLYFLSLGLAIVSIFLMQSGESRHYTATKLEYYGEFTDFETPDVIICPYFDQPLQKYEFNVKYNEQLIKKLGMNTSDVNELTRIKFDACKDGNNCKIPERECNGPLRNLTETIVVITEETNSTFPYGLDLHPLNGYLSKLKCNLDLLWKLIIDPSYYITTIEEKEYSELSWVRGEMWSVQKTWLINNLTRPVWVRKTLCAHFSSISVGRTGGEYIAFAFRSKPVHVNYWIGSLAYQKLGPFLQNVNLSNSNENNIAANYLRYSLTEMVDQTEKERVCKSDENRKILRGLKLSCDVTLDVTPKRFYEWSIAQGFSVDSNTVIIGRFSKLTIVKKATFTNYSRFQMTANLIACFVGHSVMQIFFAFFEIYQKKFHLLLKVESKLKLSVLLILVAATCSMGYIDLKFYFDQQYNSVYVRKKASLPDPTFELNKMGIQSSGYINVTKFRELNISFEFYSFMRHAALYSDRVIAIASKTKETYAKEGDCEKIAEFPNRTLVINKSIIMNMTHNKYKCSEDMSPRILLDPLSGAITDWNVDASNGNESVELLDLTLNLRIFQSLRTEALTVSRKLGLDSEATIAELVKHFSLDPKQFATCSFGNWPFDCSEYWVNYRTLSDHNLALRLPMGLRDSLLPGKSPDSIENALKISIDTRQVHAHSDINLYLGPRDSGNISAQMWYACQQPLNPGLMGIDICRTPNSGIWGVQLLYPGSWIAGANRVLSPTKFVPTGKHVIDLRVSFDEKLEQSHESECVNTQYGKPCRHPQQDINTIFHAVQLNHWCGCINCLAHDESEYMLSEVQRIIDGPTSCCTTSILTTCYTKYLAYFQKPNGTITEMSQLVLRTLYHGITMKYHIYKDWWKADDALMKDTIQGYDYFSNDVKERLIKFAQKCFATPCKKYSVHLNNYFVEDSDDGFLNFTIFYVDADASGTEEEDRFQVADFIGVLTCSFSFTFGIGLVGLCEIIFTFCKNSRRGSKFAMSLLKQKLERSLGVWIEIRGSKPASPTDTKTVETSAARETILRASKPSTPSNQNYPISEEILQSLETPSNEPEKSGNKFEGNSKNNGTRERLLVIVFSFSAALMAVTIASFFASTKGNEFDADVLSGPMVKQPSIVFCVESSVEAIRLWSSLKSSRCQASNLYIESEKPCSEYFRTFFRNRKDEFCFMFDRTRSPEIQLGQVTADFIMQVPADFPEVAYAIEGFAKSRSVAELAPFLKWSNFSLQIPYNVKITKTESECEDKARDISIENCGADFMKKTFPSKCCLSNENHFIPLVLEDSCTTYEYGFSISRFWQSFQSSSNFTKSFIVKSVYDFAFVTKVKQKYDNLMLLSIVGGFVGSFIELTIFNCFSMIFLTGKTIMFCMQKILKR